MAIQDLVQVLQELTDAHRQLLDIAVSKKDVIIDNKVDKLNQLVNKEAKLVKQVAELEEKRLFEMSRYLVGKGYRPNPAITVSELAKTVVRVEEKQSLVNAQVELSGVLKQLKEINDLNQQLIRQTLSFIDYSIDVLTISPDEDAIYHHPGQQSVMYKRSGMFDTRA